MRIWMVIQAFRPRIGGAELQLERLLPRLAERGVEAVVVTRAQPGVRRRERVGGAEIRRTLVAGDTPRASVVFVLQALAWVVANRRRIDVVHAHGALSEGAIALTASYLGLPVLVKILRTGHAGDFAMLFEKPGGRLRARLLARRAWFVAISEETRRELLDLGTPADRILSIPNGVDTSRFRPATGAERSELRAALGLAGSDLVGVYVGRLIDVKRVDVLLRALPAVPGLGLAVVGDGPEREPLERLAAELAIAERVRFLGATSRVDDVLRAADAFLLPSLSEGLSNALLEAMACGLACAVSEASADVVSGGAGLVVRTGDVDAWTDALVSLAGDADLRARLGAAAVERVADRYSIDGTAERLVEAYGALASRRRRRS